MCRVLAIANQKGGVAKTTTTVNLGIALAQRGKHVLLVDNDPQGSLTVSLGEEPDKLDITLTTLMDKIVDDTEIGFREGILSHPEGVDFIPANIELSGTEVSLVTVMCGERVLKQYIGTIREQYDYILIDCNPSLGMLTLNALAAADEVLIPVEAQYLSARGMELLLQTVRKVQRQINPKLKIAGVLLTKVQRGASHPKRIAEIIRQNYGRHIPVFDTTIPLSVRAADASATGGSILRYDSHGKVAEAYQAFADNLLEGV